MERFGEWLGVAALVDVVRRPAPGFSAASASDDEDAPAPLILNIYDTKDRVSSHGLSFGLASSNNRSYLVVESDSDDIEVVKVDCCLAKPEDHNIGERVAPVREGPQWQFWIRQTDLSKVRSGELQLVVFATCRTNGGPNETVAVVYDNVSTEATEV